MKIYCKGYGLNCEDCKKEKCIDSRGKAECHNKVVCPGIYKHFKHDPKGDFNNYMYCTIGISKPLKSEQFPKEIWKYETIACAYTEDNLTVIVHKINNQLYHCCDTKDNFVDELVIYKSLYDGSIPYARPYKDFISKAPEGRKENITGQVYRFEEVD